MNGGGWVDRVQPITGKPSQLFTAVLASLNDALDSESAGDDEELMYAVLDAAGYIVGWRQGLSEQGDERGDRTRLTDRWALRAAVKDVVDADGSDADALTAFLLRNAEACLRTIWNRHNDEGDR